MSGTDQIRSVVSFSWPFVRTYWVRLVLGILLGISFGIFNASFVWGTKTLFERLEPVGTLKAPQIQAVPGGLQKALESANESLMLLVDKWLPQAGRELDGRRILGGLLFLPILAV